MLLGLLAAISAGTSDFVGGFATRRSPVVTVTMTSQIIGCAASVVVALFISSDPSSADFAWGAVGGIAGALGLLAIYAGYARARVGIAAPIAGVGAAAIPVVVDSFSGGESLSVITVVGVGIGLVAIALTSMGASGGRGTVVASLAFGAAGALGLGLLLTGLAQAGEDSGLWPLVAARAGGGLLLLVGLVVAGEQLAVERSTLPLVVAIGVLVTGANGMFLAASRVGSTTVAAVVTSMFPAVTVLWAWKVFGERLRSVQIAGIALALVAVALIASG